MHKKTFHKFNIHCGGCPQPSAYKGNVCALSLSCFRLFMTPWTVARQAPLSLGFSSQEYWSGLPFPSPGDLPDPGNEPMSLALAGGFFYD